MPSPELRAIKEMSLFFLLHLLILNNGAFASEPFIQLWCMISTEPINTVLDDLNGTTPWFPLCHKAPALIFVCQQWHAISSSGSGAKTQVSILSALMVLMAQRMSQTACHWKRNAAYGMTSWKDSCNTMFHWFYHENILAHKSKCCRKGNGHTLSKNIQWIWVT